MLSSPTSFWRNPRVACVTALTLVFLCGAVVGALAHNVASGRASQRDPFWTESGKVIYMERVKRELELTPVQAEQMETILDDFAKYYRTVLSDGKTRILQILDDGQRQKFDRLLQESQR
jgi:hypothetical protein